MATLHPFRALRPRPQDVQEVACVPYDVISVSEARALAEGRPNSFLHVIRPEVDLPEGTDEHADEVYEKGAENLRRLAESEVMTQEEEPALYVYRLVMDGREQTGIFGCVSVADYDDEVILKHEKTRPVKEDDRTRHILTQEAHAEPVMLTFRDDDAVAAQVETARATDPLYDFEAEDGVRHTVWRAPDADALVEAFGSIEHLYVADGHHRCKAASRAAHELGGEERGEEEFEFFPAVLFPMDEMEIMAYNRIIFELPVSPEAFLEQVREQVASLTEAPSPVPTEAGVVCMYLEGTWYRLELPASDQDEVSGQLDVARLGEHLLEPLLNITDPRRDANIAFVGGIRGTAELEERVDSGDAQCAFSMYPTQIEELLAVSDAGELMPPKSTWFEPKLRSGLLVHRFNA